MSFIRQTRRIFAVMFRQDITVLLENARIGEFSRRLEDNRLFLRRT
ncbi:MAG TPA: hypothetical protein VHE54_08610 [Puia sp.]|nr:hypothetical protein [Puia sp.]